MFTEVCYTLHHHGPSYKTWCTSLTSLTHLPSIREQDVDLIAADTRGSQAEISSYPSPNEDLPPPMTQTPSVTHYPASQALRITRTPSVPAFSPVSIPATTPMSVSTAPYHTASSPVTSSHVAATQSVANPAQASSSISGMVGTPKPELERILSGDPSGVSSTAPGGLLEFELEGQRQRKAELIAGAAPPPYEG
jgi:hypothetical protein